jgi:NTE family protein
MVNPAYGTNDRMQEIYDEFMFHGATYADMNSKGRPLISINATDVSYGTVFPFTQDQFDLICSDLEPFPVARAVAASNGSAAATTRRTRRSRRPSGSWSSSGQT